MFFSTEEEIKRKTSKINFNAPLAHNLASTRLKNNLQAIQKHSNKHESSLFESIDGTYLKINEEFLKKLST